MALGGDAERTRGDAGQEARYLRCARLRGKRHSGSERSGEIAIGRDRERPDVAGRGHVGIGHELVLPIEQHAFDRRVGKQKTMVIVARQAHDAVVEAPEQLQMLLARRDVHRGQCLTREPRGCLARAIEEIDRHARQQPVTNVQPLRNCIEREGDEGLPGDPCPRGMIERPAEEPFADAGTLAIRCDEQFRQEPEIAADPAEGVADESAVVFGDP